MRAQPRVNLFGCQGVLSNMAEVVSGGAASREGLFPYAIIGLADGPGKGAEVLMGPPTVRAGTAVAVISELHRAHYRSLVAFAGLYLGALADAEDAVQDTFAEVLERWDRIRDPDKALLYLRRAVINKAKSQLRHRQVVDRHPPLPPGWVASGEDSALGHLADERIVAVIRSLPAGQRDCVWLRLGLDLSEKETARVLEVSVGTVKKQVSRARERLGPILEELRK